MKLGLMIGSEYTSLRSGVELARSAEQAGFESLWMPEFWRSYSVPGGGRCGGHHADPARHQCGDGLRA